jgi:hypothetical protein
MCRECVIKLLHSVWNQWCYCSLEINPTSETGLHRNHTFLQIKEAHQVVMKQQVEFWKLVHLRLVAQSVNLLMTLFILCAKLVA